MRLAHINSAFMEMTMNFKLALAAAAMAAAVSVSSVAQAGIITFDAQGLTGPSYADEASAQNVTVSTTIGDVVFRGGAILTDEASLPADETSTYYTSFALSGGVDAITITFPQAISNFFLNVYNGQVYPDTFTVADNVGNSNTVTLPSNSDGGVSLVSFPAAGTVVTISTSDTSSFDFSIDNIGFDQATPSAAPEPSTWILLLAGLGGVGLILRRAKSGLGFGMKPNVAS